MHADVATLEQLFPHAAPIERGARRRGADELGGVSAKCAVYFLSGPRPEEESAEHPYLLATVGNLRAALRRRLADIPAELHSKRIQYGHVCTRLRWRIVHSPFAANWWYSRAARDLFPETYRELLPFRPAWWIGVEKAAALPKLRRTHDLSDEAMKYAGPVRDKIAAGKLIETVEDVFDLCRYHHILLQAPHGKACAYKEMGKCPAPCDGSVPLSWYAPQMEAAFGFISGETRATWKAATASAMRAAAADLNFEHAARIKQRLTRAALIESEPFAHLAPLETFAFLALQPGAGKSRLEPWLIHPALNPPVQSLAQFRRKDLPAACQALFARCREIGELPAAGTLGKDLAESMALLAHHLYRSDADPGLYLPLRDVLREAPDFIIAAAEKLFARKHRSRPLPENASDKTPDAEPPVIPAAAEPVPPS